MSRYNATSLRASDRARKNSVRFYPSSMKLLLHFRKSAVPEGGWTHENFTPDARASLHQDMVLMRRAVMLRAMRLLIPALTKIMREQIENIIDSALNSFSRLYGLPIKGAKDSVVFTVPSMGNMWADAIEQELARSGSQVVVSMTPAVQSVMDDVFEKTTILLGAKPTRAQRAGIATLAREIGARIGNINDTTKRRLIDTIAEAINDGKPIAETAEIVRRRIPQIATNRVPTIVRTEMGNAVDEATKYSMHQSGVVTHFDVIGCEAVERNSPKYNGIPTCNISGVPIRDRNKVKFHPNHTGCIVPSGFVTQDGSVPEVDLMMGEGEGVPDGGEPI